jgi:Vitamin K-dependent gamma-carboxylase
MTVARDPRPEWRKWLDQGFAGWNQFWFTPEFPQTLAIIRIATGSLLLYSHCVWGSDLLGFFGAEGRLSEAFTRAFHGPVGGWSFLNGIQAPALLIAIHGIGTLFFAALTVGVFTPIAAIGSFLMLVSYVHRGVGSLFGFDQIAVMLSMYLMVGDSGGVWSVDAWRKKRQGVPSGNPKICTHLAIRLIQVHMCIVYLFAGMGKLQGESWWAGTAIWLSISNYEYQSIDVTFLRRWPWLINLITHVTLFWELFYVALIWPRWMRPVMLALAIPLHGGIAVCLGMITFGIIMLVGNLAFVPSEWLREGGVFSRQAVSDAKRLSS